MHKRWTSAGQKTQTKRCNSVNVGDTLGLRLTNGNVDGVAGWRAEQLRGKATLDPVTTTVAALVEHLRVGQGQLHPGLAGVGFLCDHRRGHAVLVQVEVADVVTQQNTAAEANSLPRREDSVRGQQGEGGS